MAAALELARRGIASTIVEKAPGLGGMADRLACKGSPRCIRCDACYPRDLRSEVERNPLVTVMTGATVTGLERTDGGLLASVLAGGSTDRIDAAAAIVATGALPYDADLDPRLHHADCLDVLSAEEAERTLAATGTLVVPSTGRPPEELAIVQCVGSRDVGRGMPYCSKACCKYGYRLGRHLRSLFPELRVTFFYMDWRPLEDERDALERWAAEDDHVVLVRSRPSEVLPGERPVVRYAHPGEYVVEEPFDLVVLSVGIVAPPENAAIAALAGLGRDEHGFLRSGPDRIFLAGTCSGPKDIRESVEEGIAAAGLAARRMEGGT